MNDGQVDLGWLFPGASLDVPWRPSLPFIHYLAPWAPQSPLVFLPPKVGHQRWRMTTTICFLHGLVFPDQRSLFPTTAAGSSENRLCADTQRRLGRAGGPHERPGTARPESIHHPCGWGPLCSHRQLRPGETPFTKLSGFATKESSEEKWHENQNPPCSSSLGKASHGEPGLHQENQPSQSVPPFLLG